VRHLKTESKSVTAPMRKIIRTDVSGLAGEPCRTVVTAVTTVLSSTSQTPRGTPRGVTSFLELEVEHLGKITGIRVARQFSVLIAVVCELPQRPIRITEPLGRLVRA
jgi:hypothetical protein